MCTTVVHMDSKPFLGQVQNFYQIPPEHCRADKTILQERMAKSSNKRTVSGYSFKFRPDPHNVENTLDDSGTHAFRLRKQYVGFATRAIGSCYYAPILVCR